jgi:hypothetical protein
MKYAVETGSVAIIYIPNFIKISYYGPPQWSSGESSWLQIQRSGFDSRCYQILSEK